MTDDILKRRLRDPDFGIETSERLLRKAALDRILELEARLAGVDAGTHVIVPAEPLHDLINAVEGIEGQLNYGTWRSERTNLRMKDTDEWVSFYVAIRAAQEKNDEKDKET